LIVPSAFRRRADRHELRAGRDGGLERAGDELARGRVEPHGPDRDAALDGERAPGVRVGVVVELRDHDLVAGAPRAAERAREVVRQRRHVRPERDLLGRAAEEVGERRRAPSIAASVSCELG
jgi:hypothetical protein